MSLTRLIAEAKVLAGGDHPCYILGHKWVFYGGCACDCGDRAPRGGCSFSVHECSVCGDCDYGQNAEADEIRRRCSEECAGSV